jgi:hypothetical protein
MTRAEWTCELAETAVALVAALPDAFLPEGAEELDDLAETLADLLEDAAAAQGVSVADLAAAIAAMEEEASRESLSGIAVLAAE